MFDVTYSLDELIENPPLYDSHTGEYDHIPLNYSMDELDAFCLYSVTTNAEAVTHAALANMRSMFLLFDDKIYERNDDMKARIAFIRLALEARVEKHLTSRPLIKQYIKNNCDNRLQEIIEELIKESVNKQMPNDECIYMNTLVYENLVSGWSITYSKELQSLLDKKDVGYYHKTSDFAKEFKKLIDKINDEVTKAQEYLREGRGFDLDEDDIESSVHTIMEDLNAPTNKIRTGIQFLNKMLNGGFESGRSYLFAGISGVGKSIVLLSCALWAKKFNTIPEVDGKKNAVLFISQENSKQETFERIFNINVTGEDIRNFSDEEIIRALKEKGIITKRDKKDSIQFKFRYFTDKEIGVDDIDSMIQDFDRQGVRIIMVVQDYIEKLKPKYHHNELRHDLGDAATELSELAKKWQIPVVSAAQLNRNASSVVTDAVTNNKTNTIKLLGKAQVSEAWDMIKNVDSVIIINREVDDTQEGCPEYMGFKLEKFRGKPNKDKIFMFLHPFDRENGILLTPDIDGAPLSRRTIEEFNPLNERRKQHMKAMDEEIVPQEGSFLDYCSDLIKGDFTEDDDGLTFSLSENMVDEKPDRTMERMLQSVEYEKQERRRRLEELEKLDYSQFEMRNGLVVMHRIKPKKKDDLPPGPISIHRIPKNK